MKHYIDMPGDINATMRCEDNTYQKSTLRKKKYIFHSKNVPDLTQKGGERNMGDLVDEQFRTSSFQRTNLLDLGHVGDGQVVPDDLHVRADLGHDLLPIGPVVLCFLWWLLGEREQRREEQNNKKQQKKTHTHRGEYTYRRVNKPIAAAHHGSPDFSKTYSESPQKYGNTKWICGAVTDLFGEQTPHENSAAENGNKLYW